MSKILDLLREFDIAAMLPEMGTFLGRITLFLRLILLAGPIIMLGLGLIYFFIPPKEANHALGYRSRRSMGSVEAWQYAQRMAGFIYMCLGGALTIAMIVMAIVIGNQEIMSRITTSLICVIIQVVLIVAAWITIEILLSRYYDINGNRKRFV